MKKITLLLVALIFISCNTTKTSSQTTTTTKELQTVKYAGVYSYGSGSTDTGAIGHITVFPETDNTILFYINLNLGPKSYNGGVLYGRLLLKDGKGVFSSSSYIYQGTGCKWDMNIQNDILTIKTIENNCGFGHRVSAGGTYTRKDKRKPDFFENIQGEHIYFAKTSPEAYKKEGY